MQKRIIWLAAVALIAAGCGSGETADETTTTTAGETTTTTTAETTTTTVVAPAGATLELASTDLGDIIVDQDGLPLYLFVPDAQGQSTCYDQCAANWPPLTGDVALGAGLDDSKLGAVERTDGETQVTYNGWPLYYFANDAAAGDINGQGINDVWYVLDADGDAIAG